MYQVILSINNNEEVAVLPAVPTDLGPQLPQNNGTYEGLSGDYNTLGPMGLWEMSIASFFPVGRRYSFMPADAWTGSMWTSSSGTAPGCCRSGSSFWMGTAFAA